MSARARKYVVGLQAGLVGALTLAGVVSTALALPPVVATKDRQTKLDLTRGSGLDFRLLDCGVRVIEEQGRYFLVNGSQRVRIPKNAIKATQDNAWVEIAVNGTLLGIPLRAVWANLRTPADPVLGRGYVSGTIDSKHSTSVVHYFLVTTPDRALSEFRKHVPENSVHFVGDKGEPAVVVVLSPPSIESTSGYPLMDWHLSKWLRKPPLVQVDFECRENMLSKEMETSDGK